MVTKEFVAKSVNPDGERDEVRFSNEEEQENFVMRFERGKFEQNATYKVAFTLKEKAPEPPTVIAELPAEDAGSLPATAEIKKGRK